MVEVILCCNVARTSDAGQHGPRKRRKSGMFIYECMESKGLVWVYYPFDLGINSRKELAPRYETTLKNEPMVPDYDQTIF